MTDFLNYLINGLSLGSIYALIAVGYTMVYGIIKLINFAHGEFYMFGAFVAYFVVLALFGGRPNGPDLGLLPLLAAMLLAGAGTGLLAVLVERAVYRPLRSAGRIVALLAALGVSLFLQNAGQQTVGADYRTFPHTIPEMRLPRTKLEPSGLKAGEPAQADISVVYERRIEGGTKTLFVNIATRGEPIKEYDHKEMERLLKQAEADGTFAAVYAYPQITVTSKQGVIVTALLFVSLALFVLVQHTRFGRAMRAVSHDFETASLMGINVNWIIAGTFFVGAMVAGIGGTLAGGMFYPQVFPLMGLMPGLKAFVAAVFGGIGSIPGALLGGVMLGVAEKLVEAYFSSLYADAFTFSILILMLLIRPSGLLGRTADDKV